MRVLARHSLDSLLLLTAGWAGCTFASEQFPLTLTDCANIVNDAQRLACFDRLAANSRGKTPESPAQVPPANKEEDILARHWELAPAYKQGLFVFRQHYDNYLLFANYNSEQNEAPFSPFRGLAPEPLTLSKVEIKYQLGFKMKLLQDIPPAGADLWFGYTQQSNWQAYNRKASSPFRDTNYQPELMAVVPLDYRLGAIRVRMLNIGLLHESNGQALNLSRSWNRAYGQLGMENQTFTLSARLWKRIGNGNGDDDNPDILDYMGHGDIHGTYKWKKNEFSLRARRNFSTDRGALQVSWAYPLTAHLKAYVQAFSGYGQSLIDYNFSQKSIGIGVSVSE
jgi:phospholipase A1